MWARDVASSLFAAERLSIQQWCRGYTISGKVYPPEFPQRQASAAHLSLEIIRRCRCAASRFVNPISAIQLNQGRAGGHREIPARG